MGFGGPRGAHESQLDLLVGSVSGERGAPMKRRSGFVMPTEAVQCLAEGVEDVGALGRIVDVIQGSLESVQRHRFACGRLRKSEINDQPRGQRIGIGKVRGLAQIA